MAKNNRVLYQFPLSLYCEKSRWNLDAKGLAYTCRDLLPGPHALTAWRLARQRSLPVLRDGGFDDGVDVEQAIGDSTMIALYLERRYPQHPLLPTDPIARQKVLGFEDWFDELGEHVRRYCWSMAIDRPEVSEIFFGFPGYARWQQMLATYSRPLLRVMLRRTFSVYPVQTAASLARIEDALQRLEGWLQNNPKRYLVGNQFTLADLTAACMLAPLIGPELSPWTDARLPRLAEELRTQLRARAAGQWVLRIYQEHRMPFLSANLHPDPTSHRNPLELV